MFLMSFINCHLITRSHNFIMLLKQTKKCTTTLTTKKYKNKMTSKVTEVTTIKRVVQEEEIISTQASSLSNSSRSPIGDGKLQKKQILVCGWNVNGIRAVLRKGALQDFINERKPDFFCLNQTKIDQKFYESQIQDLNMPKQYYQYWNFCKLRPGYSGVMILTPHKPLKIIQDIPEEQQHNKEGRLITLEYESFYVVSVYKPNSGKKLERLDYVVEYDNAFNKYMKKLKTKKDVIIFGDMNMAHTDLDLHNPEANVGKPGCLDSQRWSLNDLVSSGFVDAYRAVHPTRKQYTYWAWFCNSRQRNLGWRMDYILSSTHNLEILDAVIYETFKGSDHCPVSALYELK